MLVKEYFVLPTLSPCHLDTSPLVMSRVVERSALPLGLSKKSPKSPQEIPPLRNIWIYALIKRIFLRLSFGLTAKCNQMAP